MFNRARTSTPPPSPLSKQEAPLRGEIAEWGALPGAAATLAIAQIARSFPGVTVVLTEDIAAAEQQEDELRFFLTDEPQYPIIRFLDRETLPYDVLTTHENIISERLRVLYELSSLRRGLFLIAIKTAVQRLAPPDWIAHRVFLLAVGQSIDLPAFRTQLFARGYRAVSEVLHHGEFAARGSLLDVYPMGSPSPYRIDWLDNTIDSIRTFDPETQLSLKPVEQIRVLPAEEFSLDSESIQRFGRKLQQQFGSWAQGSLLYQDIQKKIIPAGIEYYSPLFFDRTATLWDYLPEGSLIIQPESTLHHISHFWEEITHRYDLLKQDARQPILPPNLLFVSPSEWKERNLDFRQIRLHAGKTQKQFAVEPLPNLENSDHSFTPLYTLRTWMESLTSDTRTLLCAETLGRQEALIELLKTEHLSPSLVGSWSEFLASSNPFCLAIAPLEDGFRVTTHTERTTPIEEDSSSQRAPRNDSVRKKEAEPPSVPPFAVITEKSLFHSFARKKRRRKTAPICSDTIIAHFTELHLGDPVVHLEYGIGRFEGLKTLTVEDQSDEYLILRYAHDQLLYVPVSSLHLIHRYSGGDPASAPLHTLGSPQWAKDKRKAAEQLRDVASELLDVYARRALRSRPPFPAPDKGYLQFVQRFPFEETPDQAKAIAAVLTDLQSEKPMDRLVSGDVGFGKTEIAMRAAFVAVSNAKQVAVLVPTTLLAQQHLKSFQDRFASFPIKIAILSRFQTRVASEHIVKDLVAGKIDIVIGTHQLLNPRIAFKNLGLLIVDEEHRFGVRQKELLKSMKSNVDVLTMTATPIPRTLNMAFSSIRDLSIISTPPARRLSVKTILAKRKPELIREAILREISRGGQVYYLCNRVEVIDSITRELSDWVPEARIRIAHGQMPEIELERTMADFYHHRFHVLVCSTIIESGIDIPSANTIIIERADTFGLAQLHQLRGRVGRSFHQAYAYLLAPDKVSDDAEKRLQAITEGDQLGSGFMIATHDLEIRGAGEILGEAQSGQMTTIGFHLYLDLLERTVDALRQGRNLDPDAIGNEATEIHLPFPARIPEDYLPDVHARLLLYKRIAQVKTAEALSELRIEMVDRFGSFPTPIEHLFQGALLRLKAAPIGVKRLTLQPPSLRIVWTDHPMMALDVLMKKIRAEPQRYRLISGTELRVTLKEEAPEQAIGETEQVLEALTPKAEKPSS